MRSGRLHHSDWRVCVSLCAATVAVLICLHQQHFVLLLDDPASLLRMEQHRCGRVLTAALAWALAETTWYLWHWRPAEAARTR